MKTRISASDARFVLLAAASLAAAWLAPSSASDAAEPARDDPKPAWRNGPVRYLLTSEEDKAFKALKTDEERAKAIVEFWARRDPSPATPVNEFKDSFFKRVEEANREFRESTGPGWTTDRGRVMLTAGYPSEKTEGENTVTWSYPSLAASDAVFAEMDAAVARQGGDGAKAAPPSAADLEARKALKQVATSSSKVTFEKNESGDYAMRGGSELLNAVRKLSAREAAFVSLPKEVALAVLKAPAPAVAGGAKSGAAAAGAAPAPDGGAAAKPGAPGTSDAGAAPVPEGIERLRQAVMGTEPKNEIGMAVSTRYFKAVDGSTRTVVMVSLKKSDIAAGADGKPRAILYARFTPVGAAGAEPVEFVEQELFSPYEDAAEGWLKYAFAWPLKRKNYELRVAASDGVEGRIATHVESLVLPDYKSGELALSSITVAHSAAPAVKSESPDPATQDRFIVGALRLVPWVKPVLGPKDDLAVFYDVYNAKPDSATSHPSLDVGYVIEKKDQGAWKKKGRVSDPDKHEETLGYTIPTDAISQWPAGDYRLTVQVKDKIANVDTSATVEFSVIK